MVDPNRKINRLNAEDITFLDECEEQFGNRFTDGDDEFRVHCENTSALSPPVATNFTTGGGGGSGGQRQNNSYRGRYNDNRNNFRGGRNRGYHRREHHYNNRSGGDDGRYRHNNRNHPYQGRNDDRAINVRREYGKFVAASRKDHSSVDSG